MASVEHTCDHELGCLIIEEEGGGGGGYAPGRWGRGREAGTLKDTGLVRSLDFSVMSIRFKGCNYARRLNGVGRCRRHQWSTWYMNVLGPRSFYSLILLVL